MVVFSNANTPIKDLPASSVEPMQNSSWCVFSSVPIRALPRNREDAFVHTVGNETTATPCEVDLPVHIEIDLLESICHGTIDLLHHEGKKSGQPDRPPEK